MQKGRIQQAQARRIAVFALAFMDVLPFLNKRLPAQDSALERTCMVEDGSAAILI
jgi:hypothetical protein